MTRDRARKFYHKTPLNRFSLEDIEELDFETRGRDVNIRDIIICNLLLIGCTVEWFNIPPLASCERDRKYSDNFYLSNLDKYDLDTMEDIKKNLTFLTDRIKCEPKCMFNFNVEQTGDDKYTINIEHDYYKGINYYQALEILNLAIEMSVTYKAINCERMWYGMLYLVDYDEVPFETYDYFFRLTIREINIILKQHGADLSIDLKDESTFLSRLVTKWKMFRNKK